MAAAEKKKSSKPKPKVETPKIDNGKPKKHPQGLPYEYLQFLDAALTRTDFRQALHNSYKAAEDSNAWNAVASLLVDIGIVDDADDKRKKELLTQIVAVNWPEVYSMEQTLNRGKDQELIGDRIRVLNG